MKENADKKKTWIVIAIVCMFALLAVYIISRFASCDGSSNDKLEVVSEPKMAVRVVGNRCSPTVQVTVRNKTNEAIDVCMTCTIYAADGSVTTGLTSSTVTLVAGETATLTATTTYTYTVLSYDSLCARFGDVNYAFY